MVRTSRLTFAAFDTCGCLYRQCAVSVFCPVCQIISLQISCKKEDARNINTDCTRCTIIAATAEIVTKLFTNLVHLSQFLFGKWFCIRTCFDIFIQLMNFCHSRDDNCHIWVGTDIAQCQRSIFDCSACQWFHINKSNIFLCTSVEQLCSLLFYNVIWEHDRFYPVQIKRTLKYSSRMRSKTDMTNLAH